MARRWPSFVFQVHVQSMCKDNSSAPQRRSSTQKLGPHGVHLNFLRWILSDLSQASNISPWRAGDPEALHNPLRTWLHGRWSQGNDVANPVPRETTQLITDHTAKELRFNSKEKYSWLRFCESTVTQHRWFFLKRDMLTGWGTYIYGYAHILWPIRDWHFLFVGAVFGSCPTLPFLWNRQVSIVPWKTRWNENISMQRSRSPSETAIRK